MDPVVVGAGPAVEKTWPDICMASGEPVWFLHPERTTIRPADLRVHLARVCRYHGALDWSVLQHLALCVELAERLDYRAGLVPYVAAHDLHEAVVGDLATHLKRLVPVFADIEHAWEGHVHRSLGLAWLPPQSIRDDVKHIDKIAIAVEMWGHQHVMASGVAERRGVTIIQPMYAAFAAIQRLNEDACWRVLCRALPALGDG
jgi:hypothetical protein